jgi:hypothetical protein
MTTGLMSACFQIKIRLKGDNRAWDDIEVTSESHTQSFLELKEIVAGLLAEHEIEEIRYNRKFSPEIGFLIQGNIPDDDEAHIPTLAQFREWNNRRGCEATDGCWVEPDGHCPHGKPSWLLELGFI